MKLAWEATALQNSSAVLQRGVSSKEVVCALILKVLLQVRRGSVGVGSRCVWLAGSDHLSLAAFSPF